MQSTVETSLRRIRGRIAEIGIRQADLADAIGMHETLLNAVLRGRRPMPKGMEAKIHAALDLLERAERAAQEARERVLAEAEQS